MAERPPDFPIAAHVASISARTQSEGARLADSLLGHSWPGGPSDRSERGALGWLRQWRPGRPAIRLLRCACSTGHCPVCN